MTNTEQRQIIAIGGSGFLTDAQTRELDHYVIRQARAENPKANAYKLQVEGEGAQESELMIEVERWSS
jgi:hypothetical protein